MKHVGTLAALAVLVALAADRHRKLRAARRDASHDPVTGLPNRRGLAAAGPAALSQARINGRGVVVVLVDLVGFKAVNDRYGHDAGDAVLRTVADRLTVAAGVVVAARLGGDEYAAVLHTDPGVDLPVVLSGLHTALTGPVAWHGATVSVGATVGAVAADLGAPIGTWLARADVAMYRARTRRTTCAVWRADRDPDPVPAPVRGPIRRRDVRRPAPVLARVDLAA